MPAKPHYGFSVGQQVIRGNQFGKIVDRYDDLTYTIRWTTSDGGIVCNYNETELIEWGNRPTDHLIKINKIEFGDNGFIVAYTDHTGTMRASIDNSRPDTRWHHRLLETALQYIASTR